MGEIKRQMIIEEPAIQAPLDLAKNFGTLEFSIDGTISKLKTLESNISKSNSTTKLTKETKELTIEQQNLNKIQKQIADITAKNNAEYVKEVTALENVKRSLKEKISLGDKDAKTITATNSSIRQLSAALEANRAAYDALSTAEQRNSKEGKDLLVVIKAQDKDLKALKKEYGQNQLEVGNYENALKNLRDELKASKSELVGIAATLGVDSKEFKDAAARSGELKNELDDLNSSVKAVSGSKFENISSSLGLVGSKLRALDFKGAASAANQLVAATKALTFSEAVSGLGSFGKTMLSLGKAILLNPIFLIASVVIGIGAAVIALKDKIPFLTAAFDAVGKVIDFAVQKGKDFLDWLGLTTFALDDKADATVNAAKKEIDAINSRYDNEIKIASAAGKEVFDLENKKYNDILSTASKAYAELINKASRHNGHLTEDEKKTRDELLDIIRSANADQQALVAAHNKDLADKAKEARLREEGDAFKLTQFLLKNEIDRQKAIVANEQKSLKDRISASEEVDAARMKLAEAELDNALSQENLTASGRKLIYAKFQQDITDITQQGVESRNKITENTFSQDAANLKKRLDKEKEAINLSAAQQQEALDNEVNRIKQAVIDGDLTREQGDKKLNKLKKQQAAERIQIEIDSLTKIRNLTGQSAEEIAKIDEQLYKLRGELVEAYYNNLEEREKTWAEKVKSFLEKWSQSFQDFVSSIGALLQSFSERRLMRLDEEQEANEKQKDALIEKEKDSLEKGLKNDALTAEQKDALKENSERRQAAIELSAEKRQAGIEARRKKEQRKAAIFEKAVALAIAGIKLAQAVASWLSVVPLGFGLSAAAAVIGAVQLAAIAAKPIPAAEKGLLNHKGGLVLAGEKGNELIRSGNNWSITKGMGLYDVAKGSQIFPHDESMRMIALSGLTPERDNRRIDSNADVKAELRAINKTIKSKPAHIIHGKIVGAQVGGTRQKYLNSLRNA